MKINKLLMSLVLAGLIIVSFNSCKKCKGEAPRARIINNGTVEADVQIKTSDGNTVNINNVQPGTASEFKSYAAGEVTFTIVVDKSTAEKTLPMSECFEYDIAIDANNNITSVPRDRND
jgi:hypothetical protein